MHVSIKFIVLTSSTEIKSSYALNQARIGRQWPHSFLDIALHLDQTAWVRHPSLVIEFIRRLGIEVHRKGMPEKTYSNDRGGKPRSCCVTSAWQYSLLNRSQPRTSLRCVSKFSRLSCTWCESTQAKGICHSFDVDVSCCGIHIPIFRP